MHSEKKYHVQSHVAIGVADEEQCVLEEILCIQQKIIYVHLSRFYLEEAHVQASTNTASQLPQVEKALHPKYV